MNKLSNTNQAVLIYILLALATIVAFQYVRNCDFLVLDDIPYVTGNPNVQAGLTQKSITWAFTSFEASNWHPVTWLSHMLDCQLFGLNPRYHHLTNLLLHIANTLLLFTVLKKLTSAVWQSAFVAAAFALHPLHVESVAWVAERKDVLSTFFAFLTLWAYAGYVEHRTKKKYLLIILFFAIGLMAKPMLVTLPFIMLLLDYWPLHRLEPDKPLTSQKKLILPLIIEKIPLFILVAASCLLTFTAQHSGEAVKIMSEFNMTGRIANAIISYAAYIIKIFCPIRLGAYYPLYEVSTWKTIAAALMLIIIYRKLSPLTNKHKYLAVGGLWYLGTLIPVIGLLQVGAQSMADRYTYFPSIGIFIIIAWGLPHLLAKWRYKKTFLTISASVTLTTLLICTSIQTRHWQNTDTLFRHTLAVTKNNYFINYNYGWFLFQNGKYDESINHLNKALQIQPHMLEIHNNLGMAFLKAGDPDRAIEHFNTALLDTTHIPNLPELYNNLGLAYTREGRFSLAIQNFNKALELKPDDPAVTANLQKAESKLQENNKPQKREQ